MSPQARFTSGDPGWALLRLSERGWIELEQPNAKGFRLRMRGDGTKAQPHSLHLSARQVRELAALLASAADGGAVMSRDTLAPGGRS